MKWRINYWFIYLLLIPSFAVIYTLLPQGFIDYGKLPDTLLVNLYYSAVTVTTLGYGDITPVNEISAALVGIEAVMGVVCIGLFLNQLAHKQLDEDKKKDRESAMLRAWIRECDKLLQYSTIIKRIEDEEELVDAVKDFVLSIDMHDFRILEYICTKYVADENTELFRERFNNEIRRIELQLKEKRKLAEGQYWG